MKKEILKKMLLVLVGVGLLCGFNYKLKADIDAWPVLEVTKNSTTICYPFYTKERDFMMILNFYVKAIQGKDVHIFWPFIKVSDGHIERVAPFWFSDNTNEFTLLPFMSKTKDRFLWFIPPIYTNNSAGTKVVFPFMIKNKNFVYIFPNIYTSKNDNYSTLKVFPFYNSEVYKGRTSSKSTYKRFLSYVRKDSDVEDVTAIYPFYYSSNQFAAERTKFWLLNYYSEKSPKQVKTTLFPFFSTSKRENANGHVDDFSVLWPLYSKKTYKDLRGNITGTDKQFLVFRNKNINGRRIFSILGCVIREAVN